MVGIAYMIGLMMCTNYFMEDQGCSIDINIMFQYNHSTIILANNSRRLAGKNSKHVKNRYLLITDKVY